MAKVNKRKEAFDIFVVGLGTGISQITSEVEQAIRRSAQVFFTHPAPDMGRHLSTLCRKTEDLGALFKQDNHRMDVYDRIATAVVEAALDKPPVTLAVYGHPRMFVYPSFQILEAATRLNLRCRVLPGISALDSILCELGIDPGFHGLQIFEANDTIARQRQLANDVPCLLFQIGSIGSAYVSPNGAAERFTRVGDYLAQFYPGNHIAALISPSTSRLFRAHIKNFSLRRLAENLQGCGSEVVLYLPPVRIRPLVYREFVNDLSNPRKKVNAKAKQNAASSKKASHTK